ncbi:hypothetical protein M8C21_001890 [Ambrosia artemisiifolia]|uniref:DUF7049 domain-containing protein n=1 Tax=Ambrosia artemisiifolia TaxID=4212 RepID=A0AAD5DBS8_AMBAR|nr:hypothetical protein M8C21_001890 [Ambrosia artemisiifolia]
MDKASVLSNIKDYIASLTSQVEELNKRNKILENELPRKQILHHDSGERLNVRIVDLDESTSDLQVVDLEVNVSRNLMLSDLVVLVLEFMKQVKNITITSIDAGTRMSETEDTMNQRGRGQLAVESPLLWSESELDYLTGSLIKFLKEQKASEKSITSLTPFGLWLDPCFRGQDATNVGVEGGFAPIIQTLSKALTDNELVELSLYFWNPNKIVHLLSVDNFRTMTSLSYRKMDFEGDPTPHT